MVDWMVTVLAVWMGAKWVVASAVQMALKTVDLKAEASASRRAAKTADCWAWTKVGNLADGLVEQKAAMWDGIWADSTAEQSVGWLAA